MNLSGCWFAICKFQPKIVDGLSFPESSLRTCDIGAIRWPLAS